MAELLKDVAALVGLAAMIATIGAHVWFAFRAGPRPDETAADLDDDGFGDVCAPAAPAHRSAHARRGGPLPACRRRRAGR